MKQRFSINFTNVPPYLQSATIEIVDCQTEDRLVEDIVNIFAFFIMQSFIYKVHYKYVAARSSGWRVGLVI